VPEIAGDLAGRAGQRWHAMDPLLPAAPGLPPGCGTELAAAGPGGEPLAAGTCEHWQGAPGSLDLTWGAARRYRLNPRVAAPALTAATAALDELLTRWRDHLSAVPEASEPDTAAIIDWPSRDVAGAQVLLGHGLAPRAVIAARPGGRAPGAAAAGRPRPDGTAGRPARLPPGTRIRRAMLADLDAVVRLGMATIRFDAHFGTVVERPWTAGGLRQQAAGLLDRPDTWTWLAERDGTPVGLLYAEPPQDTAWIAPMTAAAPVCYLELMYLHPGERGSGTAPALVEQLHREADAAGVAATLLHYEQVNPLSGPFWSRQGYRPLWISWEARPALTLR